MLKIIYKKMNKSFKLYFLDINNIILDEKVEINNDDELKIEIKEKFEFIESIINKNDKFYLSNRKRGHENI